MEIDIAKIRGKLFSSPITGRDYGAIRPPAGQIPTDFPNDVGWTPFAEDESGNYFAISATGSIGLWDHESAAVGIIADSLNNFYDHCTEAGHVELKPEQVKSAWVDPDFAKQMGIDNISSDG